MTVGTRMSGIGLISTYDAWKLASSYETEPEYEGDEDMGEEQTTTDHSSQMSLAEARRALAAVETDLFALLKQADDARRQAREKAHAWARKRRKSLRRYIEVLKTAEPPK